MERFLAIRAAVDDPVRNPELLGSDERLWELRGTLAVDGEEMR